MPCYLRLFARREIGGGVFQIVLDGGLSPRRRNIRQRLHQPVNDAAARQRLAPRGGRGAALGNRSAKIRLEGLGAEKTSTERCASGAGARRSHGGVSDDRASAAGAAATDALATAAGISLRKRQIFSPLSMSSIRKGRSGSTTRSYQQPFGRCRSAIGAADDQAIGRVRHRLHKGAGDIRFRLPRDAPPGARRRPAPRRRPCGRPRSPRRREVRGAAAAAARMAVSSYRTRTTIGASRPLARCTVITRTSSRAISMSRLTSARAARSQATKPCSEGISRRS